MSTGGVIKETLNAITEHRGLWRIQTDYFIALPCMHLTQPLIVLWFLRKSKTLVAVLTVYDVAMIAAVLLLQEHYVIDLIAGACAAVLAIAMVERSFSSSPQRQ